MKAFNKVELEPGETTRVPLHFAVQDLALTDEAGKTMVEPGSFEIMIGDASDHILLKQTISIGQNMAVSPCSIKEQLPEEIGKGNIIHIKGVVRDVQATPVDKVEIYSTAQQQVIGVTDQNGKYFIDAPEDDVLVFCKSGYLDEKVIVDRKNDIQITIRNKMVFP